MRYIYYIIGIFLILSAFFAYELLPHSSSKKDAAIKINGRIISVDELSKLRASCPPYKKERENFMNDLITKELLIQEARKEGIDKEESFRSSIQNYYEQSLIKLLIDRKLASLRVEAGKKEIDNYAGLVGKRVTLTILGAGNQGAEKSAAGENGRKMILPFEDLSEDLRGPISLLKRGETTGPVRMGDSLIRMRLDRVEPMAHAPAVDKAEIRKRLMEAKKEKIINDWLAELKRNASVEIYRGPGNQGRP